MIVNQTKLGNKLNNKLFLQKGQVLLFATQYSSPCTREFQRMLSAMTNPIQ